MYKIISLYYNIKYIVCIDYKTSFFFLFSLRPSSSSFFGYKISFIYSLLYLHTNKNNKIIKYLLLFLLIIILYHTIRFFFVF